MSIATTLIGKWMPVDRADVQDERPDDDVDGLERAADADEARGQLGRPPLGPEEDAQEEDAAAT